MLFPDYLRSKETSLIWMRLLMTEFGFSGIFIHQFLLLVEPNLELISRIDYSITLIINFWFIMQFASINYEFREINHGQISEQLVNRTRKTDIFSLTGVIFLYLLVQFFVIARFLFFLPLMFYFIYQLIPRGQIIKYSIFGPLSRPLISNLEIRFQDYIHLERITAATFGWTVGSTNLNQAFPFTLIPSEVGSIYQTGLTASLGPALKQANYIGLVISTLINIIVTISLIRFAILYVPTQLYFVLLLGAGLLVLSVVVYFILKVVNYIRIEFQQDEALIIGSSFLGRYVGNSLWIISGNKIQGTSVQRGGGQPIFRYDKIRGLQIGYQRIVIISTLLIITITISFWNLAGAINLSSLLILAPFFFNLGVDFLIEKSTADLSFFLISGYVLWGLILIIYPRLYARNNPTLYLDLQSVNITPIILKDFVEHQDASLDFTKSLISSSRPKRRRTTGRPGWFDLQLSIIEANTSLTKELNFKLGPHQRTYLVQLSQESDLPLEIVEKIRVSGMRGYPSIQIIIIDEDKQETIFDEKIDLTFGKIKLVKCQTSSFDFTIKIQKIGQNS
jgi:hypothetical protein